MTTEHTMTLHRHVPSGETYALLQSGAHIIGVAGPLYYRDTAVGLATLDYDTVDVPWTREQSWTPPITPYTEAD